jgi:hypothetical protein
MNFIKKILKKILKKKNRKYLIASAIILAICIYFLYNKKENMSKGEERREKRREERREEKKKAAELRASCSGGWDDEYPKTEECILEEEEKIPECIMALRAREYAYSNKRPTHQKWKDIWGNNKCAHLVSDEYDEFLSKYNIKKSSYQFQKMWN